MVDLSGTTPTDRATPSSGARPLAAVRAATGSPAPAPAADQARTTGLARSLAASPPVDTDRVATIKKAIAEGRFPIVPAKIADRLIALKLQWNLGDERGDASDV